MDILDALITAVMGYAIVFFGIVLLILVVSLMGKLMARKAVPVPAEPAPVAPTPQAPPAHGTGGDLMLYDTPPDVAAMIMAIVADNVGLPLNELRFISIKEIKEDKENEKI